MPESNYLFQSNDALISDILLYHASMLVEGRTSLSAVGFLSLCTVIESAVLHDRLVGSYAHEGGGLAEYLREHGVYIQACSDVTGCDELANIRIAGARAIAASATLLKAPHRAKHSHRHSYAVYNPRSYRWSLARWSR